MSTIELDPALVVRDAIVKVLGVPPERATDPQARIVEDLGGDSLDNVEISFEIEEYLALELPLNATTDATTVADLVRITSEVIATAGLKA